MNNQVLLIASGICQMTARPGRQYRRKCPQAKMPCPHLSETLKNPAGTTADEIPDGGCWASDGQHKTGGGERFLSHGFPRYGSIVMAGHSQGGAEAAFVATQRTVAGVVMLSSPPDTVRGSVIMGSGSGLGRQRPPYRCKRRMHSHIVTALSPSRSSCANPSPPAAVGYLCCSSLRGSSSAWRSMTFHSPFSWR